MKYAIQLLMTVFMLAALPAAFADHTDGWRTERDSALREFQRNFPRESWRFNPYGRCSNVILEPSQNSFNPMVISLNQWKFVGQVLITTNGMRGEQAEVIVRANGEVVGKISVRDQDFMHFVTIKETISQLELVHVSGGRVQIAGVEFLEADRAISVPVPAPYPFPTQTAPRACPTAPVVQPVPYLLPMYGNSANPAVDVMNDLIRVVDTLEEFGNCYELVNYLKPLKKLAWRAKAAASVCGPMSTQTRNQFLAVRAQIDLMDQNDVYGFNYLDNNLERDGIAPIVIQLDTIRKWIERALY